jgi:hypothetical protein
MVSIVRFHLITFIDLIKFLENPHKQWAELINKLSVRQLALF